MKYTVGAYSFDVPNPFKSNDEAVKYIQSRHPELSREEITDHLLPKINQDGFNRLAELPEGNQEGKEGNAKISEGSADRKQAGKNKPG